MTAHRDLSESERRVVVFFAHSALSWTAMEVSAKTGIDIAHLKAVVLPMLRRRGFIEPVQGTKRWRAK